MKISMNSTEGKNFYEISINPKPENCKVCPFLRTHKDEFNFTEYCMFSSMKVFGRFINRPEDSFRSKFWNF